LIKQLVFAYLHSTQEKSTPSQKKKEKWRNKLQIDSVRLSSVITSETRRDGMKTEAKRVKSGRVKKEEQGGEKS
jgi:hypothetical protein